MPQDSKKPDTVRDFLGKIGENGVALYETTFHNDDGDKTVKGLEISIETQGKYDSALGGRKSFFNRIRLTYDQVAELAKLLVFNKKIAEVVDVRAAVAAAAKSE